MTSTDNPNPTQLLTAAKETPIAQLCPDLSEPGSRVVRGEVTITWPYNSLKRTLAFLLAESDIRLRRAKGQVRVELKGSCAQKAAACGLGGGDKLALSLQGAQWTKDESAARLPSSRVEWQLNYTGKILLEIKGSEGQPLQLVNIDEPVSVEPAEPVADLVTEPIERSITPPTPDQPALRRLANGDEANEFASPAFIKRARVSYGSLFESGFDIFEDDGGVKGKGRKRTRFGRDSSAWRYASQSPSPEPEEVQSAVQTAATPKIASSSPRAPTTDEGCQTVDLPVSPTPIRYQPSSTDPAQPTTELQLPAAIPSIATPIANGSASAGFSMALDIPTQEPPQAEGLTTSSEPFGSALFGSFVPSADAYDMSQFPTANSATGFGENQIPISDQVRFGFAQPLATMEPALETAPLVPDQPLDMPTQYPEEHLQQRETLFDHAGLGPDEREAASALVAHRNPFQTSPRPAINHIEEPLEATVWPITSETLDAEHAEGYIKLSLPPESSIGVDETARQASTPTRQALPREVDDYGYNARRYQNEAEARMVGMIDAPEAEDEDEDEDDDGMVHDEGVAEDAGDDYDMRNYADVDDDEEGFEQYDDDEGEEYGEGEMLSPDDEAGSYDDENEEEEEEEEEYEEEQPRIPLPTSVPASAPASAPAPAPPGEPIVIDLLSDSEDEDGPAPQHSPQTTVLHSAPQPFGQQPGVDQPAADDDEEEEQGEEVQGVHHNIPQNVFQQAHMEAEPLGMDGSSDQDPSEIGAENAESPTYEVQYDSEEEDHDDDALGDSEEEQDDEAMEVEDEQSDMDSASSSPDDPDEVRLTEADEIVIEQQVESTATSVHVTGAGDALLQTVSETVSTTVTESHDHVQSAGVIAPALGAVYSSPARAIEEQDAMDEIRSQIAPANDEEFQSPQPATQSQGRLGYADAAPSSPPLTQRFESQVFGSKTIMVSSSPPLPPSEEDDVADQLLTPLETQANDDFASQRGSPIPLEEEENNQKAGHEPSPVPNEADVASSPAASDIKMQEDTEYDNLPPTVQDDNMIMADGVPETVNVQREEVEIEVASHTAPTASSPPPATQGTVSSQEDDELQASIREEEEEQNGLLPQEEEAATTENEAVDPEQSFEMEHDIDQVSSQRGTSPHDEISVQLEEDTNGIEQPSPSLSTKGTTVQTRSKAKDHEQAPPTKPAVKIKAKPGPIDSSVQLARSARRTRRHPDPESPTVTTRARTRSIQQSATPELQDTSVLLARAALESPSRKSQAHSDAAAAPSIASLKVELAKRLRSELPENVALKTLKSHINRKLDVLAIATTASSEPKRMKTRQYALSFNITDPSVAPTHVAEVQIYRAHVDSLPTIQPGDGVLLRGFQVVALTGKNFGLRSEETSGYAVFEQDGGAGAEQPQIRGPPVEDIGAEAGYVEALREWYGLLDDVAREKLDKANRKFADAGAGKTK